MAAFILAKMAVPYLQHKVMRSAVKVGKMDKSQKDELLATRHAPALLTELESKNLKGWSEDHDNDTLVYVDLFVDPKKRYRLTICFNYSVIRHLVACDCKDFEKERRLVTTVPFTNWCVLFYRTSGKVSSVTTASSRIPC
jgi:hypothetical protein